MSVEPIVKPIVDVRFDAPYEQVEPSHGDEWAPTWGRGDVLYTGNDDGSSFGGIPSNTIAFGKLEGDDPYKLKGTTISAMSDFMEPVLFGPEVARWTAADTRKVGNTLYKFMAGEGAAGTVFLAASKDQGKSWTRIGGGSPLFQGAKFEAPQFVHFRAVMRAMLGGEPDEYIYAASYAGMIDGEDKYLLGRVPGAKLAAGNAADWVFSESISSWQSSLEKAVPLSNRINLGVDIANWKTMNTYSIDGVLYMFVTRCHYPWESADYQRRHIFQNSSIIKSTDNGVTWTRPAQDNLTRPMFPGKRFGTAYFVWYGKDGAASVDNGDRYVYAVSNNGHFENGDDYVIGRVLRSKLPNLSAADWSFYKGGDGMADGSWTPALNDARPILVYPGKSGMTGMTYIPALNRYVMTPWSYTHTDFATAIDKKDLSTEVAFFEAPKPWGPWTKVKVFPTGTLGWYAPIIGQRFQQPVKPGAVQAFFYATGLAGKPEGGLEMRNYKFNYMPITLSTQPLEHKDPKFAGGR